MANATVLIMLLLAAMLEATGDALLRAGLHGAASSARIGLLLLGALVLFAYGMTVNLPPWDFGRLLGVYVTLFFVVTQIINAVAFGRLPSPAILLGGALIIAGGAVITIWTPA